MRLFIFVLALLVQNMVLAQAISSKELLEKAIEFHDPEGKWGKFKGTFEVLMRTPGSTDRLSVISMDFPGQQFTLEVEKDSVSYTYVFDKDQCETSLNGSKEISDENRKKYRLTCDSGRMMRDYYTYLYGLPMKLKDPGTIISHKVQTKTFKGKEYLVLKVNYEDGVGDDVWYFYFDPKTYAMEVYQFYHDESKNDGEYILLKGLENVNRIRMPKTRAWYYNKDDKYLGTDILTKQ